MLPRHHRGLGWFDYTSAYPYPENCSPLYQAGWRTGKLVASCVYQTAFDLATQQPWLTENTVLDIGSIKMKIAMEVCTYVQHGAIHSRKETWNTSQLYLQRCSCTRFGCRRTVTTYQHSGGAAAHVHPLGLGLVFVSWPRFDRPRRPPKISFYYAVLTPERNASKRWRAGALNEGCSSWCKKQRHVTSSTAGEQSPQNFRLPHGTQHIA